MKYSEIPVIKHPVIRKSW